MPHYSSGPNEYDAQGEAGARTLERQSQERHQAYEEQLQQSHLRITQAHEAFEEARRQRQEAAALALAKRKTEIEKKLAISIPNLINIDPSLKDAEDRYIDWANKHPEAFDPELAPKSVIAQYEGVGRRIDAYKKQADAIQARKDAADAARQAREDAKAALQQQHNEKKATIDAIVGKGGGQAKSAVIDGVTYELPGPKQEELKQKKLDKAQKDFETGFKQYQSANQTIAEAAADPANAGKIPISLLQSQNANRILMHTAAAKLKAANPEQAPEIDDTIKQASLGEHALLQTQLNEIGNPTEPKGIERKKQIIGDLNTLKKTLGFDTMRVDEAGMPVLDAKGKVITDKAELISHPVTSVTEAKSPPASEETPNTAGTQASPVATDDEPLSTPATAPVNPNIAGDTDKVDPDTPVENESGEPANVVPPAASVVPTPAPVADVKEAPVQPAPPAETAPAPDITQEDHAKLKPGEKFWWKGKQLIKQ